MNRPSGPRIHRGIAQLPMAPEPAFWLNCFQDRAIFYHPRIDKRKPAQTIVRIVTGLIVWCMEQSPSTESTKYEKVFSLSFSTSIWSKKITERLMGSPFNNPSSMTVFEYLFQVQDFSGKDSKDFYYTHIAYQILPPLQKKKPVDFDGKLKIGDVRYHNIT